VMGSKKRRLELNAVNAETHVCARVLCAEIRSFGRISSGFPFG